MNAGVVMVVAHEVVLAVVVVLLLFLVVLRVVAISLCAKCCQNVVPQMTQKFWVPNGNSRCLPWAHFPVHATRDERFGCSLS